MKKTLLTTLILCTFSIVTFSQKKPKIKGNKNLTEINKEIIDPFHTIEISDALEITLHQGDQNKYFLKTDENLVDIIQFKVKEEVLHIYTTNRIVKSKKLNIDLTVADISQIIIRNNVKIKSDQKLKLKKININAYDSSRFDLSLEADDIEVLLFDKVNGLINIESVNTTLELNDKVDLKANIRTDQIKTSLSKSTKLKLEGIADNATFNLKGSSKLNAKKMKIASIDLNASNTADVNIYARNKVELHAKDKSIVHIYGNPKLDVKNLTEKSKIIKK